MKKILMILILSAIHIAVKGQYYHNSFSHTSGTQTVACTDVTVTSTGVTGNFTCGATGPYSLSSFSGTGGSYTWSFAPGADGVRLNISSIDVGEMVKIKVNGIHINFNFYGGPLLPFPDPTCMFYSYPGTPGITLGGDLQSTSLASVSSVSITLTAAGLSTLLSGALINSVEVECIQAPYGAGIFVGVGFDPSVNAPAPIVIPGPVCTGTTITLTDIAPGGTWSSSTPGVATIDASTGFLTGVSDGVTTITYTTFPGCYITTNVIVGTSPIGGPSSVCEGSNITLLNAVAGGTWSSSNAAIATIDAINGVLTGASVGSVTITYTSLPGCFTTTNITVLPIPSVITGGGPLCTGTTITLNNATAAGQA